MANLLAAVHGVEVNTVGLAEFGRPGNYYQRQVERWIGQYRSSETVTIPAMDELCRWLPLNIPVDDGEATLVHGDFRLDNMIFAHDRIEVIGLLDWELSTLGHPYADLAYQCMQLRMDHTGAIAGLGGLDRNALGIPDEQSYVNMYCEARDIGEIPHWGFYIAFSAFRFAAILQGVHKRALDGNASSKRAAEMGELVTPLAEMGAGEINGD